MDNIAIGLASGLGNTIFMLPTIKALKLMGHPVSLYVQADFPLADLWKRCKYADEVIELPADTNGHECICGQWRPAVWSPRRDVAQRQIGYPYSMSEWKSNFRLAQDRGWNEAAPDVTDWCKDLDRAPRCDIGIVPGSKGGTWLRKRWPGMASVAQHYLDLDKSVAVFGTLDDGIDEIPGEAILTPNVANLPDVLAGCGVIIGTDSGVTHLASSLGVPTVIIFTATSRIKGEAVGPHKSLSTALGCYPCQSTSKWQACKDWKCQNISPMAVITMADGLREV
jgi:ADP-heptose:LPS heptosyltransferase